MIKTLCNICPRECGIDRKITTGFCGEGDEIRVARYSLHQWEEPFISGEKGSGTVFFSGCSLRCAYCQNYVISHRHKGDTVSEKELMQIFDSLIEQGASNINLVTPTHFADKISHILREYRSPVPVVYNTSGYEKVDTLKMLEGLVDIYLPDLKYIDGEKSARYSLCPDYFEYASSAIKEMIRQTGEAVFDDKGMMKKGTVIRHLVLPKNTNQTIKIIDWLKDNVPLNTYISLMSQFTPVIHNDRYPELNRRITPREYEKTVSYLYAAGFKNALVQDGESAKESFIPDF